MSRPILRGNAAKQYCLEWIDHRRVERGGLRLLDLGCGDGSQFRAYVERHREVTYVGVEPDPGAAAAARAVLEPLGATVVNRPAYDLGPVVGADFDVVVSFSALEHVYRRADYLRSARDCLVAGGHLLINYDAGHFTHPQVKDRLRNAFGGLVARLGRERRFQRFVSEAEFHDLVETVGGLRVVESRSFNLHSLKHLAKAFSGEPLEDYADRWLAFEVAVNELGLPYRDQLASLFGTRNHILVRT